MIGKILLTALLIGVTLPINGFCSNKPKKKRVIVLDAGHGGKDSGAAGINIKEKDVVLAIVLKIGDYIEKNLPDVQVIYTRKTDVYPPLDKRTEIANKNNADLFISVHANANKSNIPFGTETYAMGLHVTEASLEVAQKENSVILQEEDYNTRYEGFDPNSTESYIMFSLMLNAYLEKSLTMASYVQDEFREKAKRTDRGVKQAGFLVLWKASMPSILIEVGFISHPEEEAYMMSTSGQDILASAIYRAIKRYLNNLEKDELEYVPNESVEKTITNKADSDSISRKPEKNVIAKTDSIVYRIQVTSSTKQISYAHPVFKNYSDVFEYKENNTFKYTVGKSLNYEDIKVILQKVKTDFPGAFVVAFKNNMRVDIKQVIDQKSAL